METWFLYTLAAAVLAGIHMFIQRVGSARGYTSNHLNSYSTLVSGTIGLSVAAWLEGFAELSWLMIAVAVINGAIYLWGANLRMDAMQYIDTTILLPLQKFVSPLLALAVGVLFLSESLNGREWLGVILGAVVPLLLLSRSEKDRQNNLARGLILMLLSAGIVVINAVVNKEAVGFFESVLLFGAVGHFGSVFLSWTVTRIGTKAQKSSTRKSDPFDPGLLKLSAVCGVVQFFSFAMFLYAFASGGPLAIVYTIHSLYILIPIVLAIIIYGEHWNLRKVIAIIASIAAIGLMR